MKDAGKAAPSYYPLLQPGVGAEVSCFHTVPVTVASSKPLHSSASTMASQTEKPRSVTYLNTVSVDFPKLNSLTAQVTSSLSSCSFIFGGPEV
jgi:hypothetical protein